MAASTVSSQPWMQKPILNLREDENEQSRQLTANQVIKMECLCPSVGGWEFDFWNISYQSGFEF